MSGSGAPQVDSVAAPDLRVGVVAAPWHQEVMEGLLGGALRALADAGVVEPTVVRVPRSFELPVVAASLARSGYDAVVALGVVIRGVTPHFRLRLPRSHRRADPGCRGHRRPGWVRRTDVRP